MQSVSRCPNRSQLSQQILACSFFCASIIYSLPTIKSLLSLEQQAELHEEGRKKSKFLQFQHVPPTTNGAVHSADMHGRWSLHTYLHEWLVSSNHLSYIFCCIYFCFCPCSWLRMWCSTIGGQKCGICRTRKWKACEAFSSVCMGASVWRLVVDDINQACECAWAPNVLYL